MSGYVLVADPEREIDGVDVVEMARAGNEVDQQHQQPDGERRPSPHPDPRRGPPGRHAAPTAGRVRLRHRRQPTTRSGMRSFRLPVR